MANSILLLRKERVLPEFWIFCSLNNWYEKRVKKSIERFYRKFPNIKIIADAEFFPMLSEAKIPYVKLSKYAPNTYENTYTKARKIVRELFSEKAFKGLEYKGYPLCTIIEEEFMYSLTEYVKNIDIIQEVIEREKPESIFVINNKTLFGSTCRIISQREGISFNSILAKAVSWTSKKINDFLRDCSLTARFFDLPRMRRKEFVKTGIKNKFGEKFILFSIPWNYYYDRLRIIMNEAKSRGIKIRAIVNDVLAQKKAEKEDIEYFSFGDYFANNRELNSFKKELRNIWKKLIEQAEKGDIFFIYNKLDIFPIIKDYLKYLFRIRLLCSAYYLESYENLFRKNKIKAVVLMSDLITADCSLALVAKKYNVPSLVTPHGAMVDDAARTFLPLTADKMAMWGKIMKKQLMDFGVGADRLIITGPYIFNNIQKGKVYAKDLAKKCGIKKGDFVILLCTQKYEDIFSEKEVEEIVKMTLEACKGFKNAKVVISLHPREFPYIHDAVLKELKMQDKVPILKQDINELLSIADVMVGMFSTITFNAILCGKPIVYANPIKRPETFPIIKSKAAIGASNKEELAKAIKRTMDKEYIKQSKKYGKKFIRDYCYKIDGKAAKRIINLIKRMAKRKK